MKKIKQQCNGFTLIELSIVMVIIGLLSVALLNLYTTYNKKHIITMTGDNIKAAQAALQKYQDDNGFYPCPADPTDPLGRATNCALPPPPGIKVVAGTGGRQVRIGAMPIFDMSGETKLISGTQAIDGWKRRLSYAVTESMALDPTQFVAGNGAITVKDAASGQNMTTNGNIIVLSHGEDGTGAYSTNGVRISTCGSGSKDSENCNDDAVFVSGKRTYGFGAEYNDDYVEYNTATAVETTKACPAGSILRGLKSNGDLICTKDLTCPAGSAFTGLLGDGETANCQTVSSSCGPTEALVSLTLGAAPVCIRNMPGDCPVGYVQNGTVNQEGPDFGKPNCLQILTSCPTNYVQVGTNANHSPICVPNFNSSCPGGQIQIGNDSSGSAICKAIDLNACPAGQYMYGMNNGAPLCSGDRRTVDGNCPAGQVMTGINGDAITCSAAPSTLGPCTLYELGPSSSNGMAAGGYGASPYTGDQQGYNYAATETAGFYSVQKRYVTFEEHPLITQQQMWYAYWGMVPPNPYKSIWSGDYYSFITPQELQTAYQLRAVHNQTGQVTCFNDTDYTPAAAQHEGGGGGDGTDNGGDGPGGR